MGANTSRNAGSTSGTTTLQDLPEDCVSRILMQFGPQEICKFAQLSKSARHACRNDLIWDSKLPSNYKYIIEKVFGESWDNVSKIDIYAKLCKLHLFDDGTKFVNMLRSSGLVYYSISSKALNIKDIDDPSSWSFISTLESRYETVAYLKQTSCLEVNGQFEFKFPKGRHTLYIRLHLGMPEPTRDWMFNLESALEWAVNPIEFQISTSDGQSSTIKYRLLKRCDWIIYNAGNFNVENPNAETKINFSFKSDDRTHNKGDLTVDSVLIVPFGLGNMHEQRWCSD